jgi:hypothetical protein
MRARDPASISERTAILLIAILGDDFSSTSFVVGTAGRERLISSACRDVHPCPGEPRHRAAAGRLPHGLLGEPRCHVAGVEHTHDDGNDDDGPAR